ncbi:putative bifunctional diguanylate cyclase/phosphodiesterase [Paenibacillus sp. UNC451MF]|uniref:putative bifunctional diguanylate cyclase/phosphodiesterase n=1 Tax=Paenibacillus sp. UNC451MF TaxID=1449063 RepID=UPI00068C3C6A|nr:EAL domain-containing protein [Paenibacillus sp. UNC451MF]
MNRHHLHSLVFETASQGIMITDTAGVILTVNPAFTKTTGYTEKEAVGQNPRLLHSGKQDSAFYADMWASIHETGSWQGEIWNRRKNGEIYLEWITIHTIKDRHNKITHYIGIFSDITERKQYEDKLTYLAHYDVLTGLPNRVLFLERLQQAIEQAQISDQTVALLFMDLDHFKIINDTLGHMIGDQLLQHIAIRLRECVGSDDTIARLGGDEFTVIIPYRHSLEPVISKLETICQQLTIPFKCKDQELFVTVSIGVSLYPSDGEDTETLIKHADIAMYHAKKQKNHYQLYTTNMNDTFLRRIHLENGLRKALDREQLTIVYQPQMNLSTGRVYGLEALLRWEHSELGVISPAEFIPIAEESGLIVEIGEWVLRSVCLLNKKWQSKGYSPVKMAVNLSARQFLQHNLVQSVASILEDTGLDPHYLILEITETVSIHQIESIVSILSQFKQLGVEVAIDDFGKGYSSLSYLKQYPVHILKIDKCFVDGIDADDSPNRAIIKAIIDLAHSLNLRVIAEGVETQDQLGLLKELQCNYIQGYWLSKPLPPEIVEKEFIAK